MYVVWWSKKMSVVEIGKLSTVFYKGKITSLKEVNAPKAPPISHQAIIIIRICDMSSLK